MKSMLPLALMAFMVSLIPGNVGQDFPPPFEPILLVGDHCQVPKDIQGVYFPVNKIGLFMLEVKSDRISYVSFGTGGLPSEGELYCIWNDDNFKHMIFAKDRFEDDLELAACVEPQLADNNNLKLIFYNRWDRGPFQLNNSPSTSSNTCGDYPAGGTTVQVLRSPVPLPERMDPDTCKMPRRMRGKYHVTGGDGLVTAKIGRDFVKFGFGSEGVTERVKLWCIWKDDTRMILAKDRYEGDLELSACVTITETYSNDLKVEFLNREDRHGLFHLGNTHATESETCLRSPTEGTVVTFTAS